MSQNAVRSRANAVHSYADAVRPYANAVRLPALTLHLVGIWRAPSVHLEDTDLLFSKLINNELWRKTDISQEPGRNFPRTGARTRGGCLVFDKNLKNPHAVCAGLPVLARWAVALFP